MECYGVEYMSNFQPVILPVPYITEKTIDERIAEYSRDPLTHTAIEFQTKEIKKHILDNADTISRELAMFQAAFLTFDPVKKELHVHKPSNFSWAN